MAAPKPRMRLSRDAETYASAGDAGCQLKTAFLRDVLMDWVANGGAAIASVRAERPHDYLKLVISLFPAETTMKANALDELTDEQLGGELASLLAQLAAANADGGD